MKTALYGLMLSALLSAGCIPKAPFTWPDDDSAPAADADQPARKHVGAVRPDQVTTENATQKARELEAELDNDGKVPLPTSEAPAKK
jgi:predicted small lipoprotein YifL